ncbi:MAG: hypothetical protein WAM03_15655, partial [Pseudolabrys sp.]
KTSPYASDTRTTQIVDGKLVSRTIDAGGSPSSLTPCIAGDMGGRMNNIIWLVGAIVIVLFILGALGIRP